jgi:glycosyltransferase involved in cell wall biosynthesis
MEYQIHATNITGLGAQKVVLSLIKGLNTNSQLNECIIYTAPIPELKTISGKAKVITKSNRFIPNSFYRLIELVFARKLFNDLPTIVLGDIPLRGIKNQVVLVHQPNLIHPSINKYSSKRIKYRIQRILFRQNLKYAKRILVQTDVMAKELSLSYPKASNKIQVITHPNPELDSSISNSKTQGKGIDKKIKLFYPAAGYPHKKHDFLKDIDNYFRKNHVTNYNFEIWITLTEQEFKPYEEITFLKNFGRLNFEEVQELYINTDAVLFLSSLESLGLPLIEAMRFNLPVIAPNLDYAKWVLENKGYYFENNKVPEFLNMLIVLSKDMQSSNVINYEKELKKFSKNWNEVAGVYYDLLKNK